MRLRIGGQSSVQLNWSRVEAGQISVTKLAYFNITYHCNERCVFCAADSQADSSRNPNHRQSDITSADFELALKKQCIGEHDRILISGGEPSLNKDFLDIIAIAAKYSSNVWVSTTASCFSKDSCLAALNNGHRCLFDTRLYASSAAVHDAFTRVPGSFERTVRGLKNLLRVREERGLRYEVGVRLLLSKQTLPYLTETAEFVRGGLGVEQISVNMLIDSNSVCAADAYFGFEEARKEVAKLFNSAADLGIAPFRELPVCLLPKDRIVERLVERLGESLGEPVADIAYHYHDTIQEASEQIDRVSRIAVKSDHDQDVCGYCDVLPICPGWPAWFWQHKYGGEPISVSLRDPDQ